MFYTGKSGQDKSPFMLNPQRPDDSNIASPKPPKKKEAEEPEQKETEAAERKKIKKEREEDEDEPLAVTIAWFRTDLNDLRHYIAEVDTRAKRLEKRLEKFLDSKKSETKSGKEDWLLCQPL